MRTRMVYTKIWDDDYIQTLNPVLKVLYFFLITNPVIGQIGIFQISNRMIMFLSGLPLEEVVSGLDKFEADKKIMRHGDWIALLNAHKYNTFKSSLNAVARKGEWNNVPYQMQKALIETQDKEYIGFVSAVDAPKDTAHTIDCKKIAEEFGVPESHVVASLQNFTDYHEGKGTKISNKGKMFRVWLRNDIEAGKVKPKNDSRTWNDLSDFEKRQVMDKIDSGRFTQDWRPPVGTPDMWFKMYNEKWPRAPKKEGA